MNDTQIENLEQVRNFLKGASTLEFKAIARSECYTWIQKTLDKLQYQKLPRKDKGEVRRYLQKMTGYSRQQLTRLITEHRKTGYLLVREYRRQCFPKKYTKEDIILLAEMDELHQTLSGPATKKLCERAYRIYGDERYAKLAMISNGHLYNLRKKNLYRDHHQKFTKTQHTKVKIGERRKPQPNGDPGYLRVDTVHQGDQENCKGVYHINLVDEITQWEIICSVEKISENYLIEVLEKAMEQFPFKIKGFHSDNGSEYINKRVEAMLKKLLIEFTKSRSRHSNDNALAESKNGSVVRKWFGYVHIAQRHAKNINVFNEKYLNPYVNFHRPCFFPSIRTDKNGKEKKQYLYEQMMTPYDRFKSLPECEKYLAPGQTMKALEQIALAVTDNEAAKQMKRARYQLFKQFAEQEKQLACG